MRHNNKTNKIEAKAILELSRNPGRVIHVDSPSPEIMLSTGDFGRLEGFRLRAEKTGLCVRGPNGDGQIGWSQSLALANVTQTESYFTDLSAVVMPALMRRSTLVDLVSNRMVWAAEHWIVQGFPHPAFASEDCVTFFPGSTLVPGPTRAGDADVMPAAEQRQICGNAMHWAQISSWFLFSAGCGVRATVLEEKEEDA